MKTIHTSLTILLFYSCLGIHILCAQYIQHGKKISVQGTNQFGRSCKISEDGKTFIVGTESQGAYVFRQQGNSWVQEAHLFGLGSIGDAQQGFAVSLSGDGNTAIVGGPGDNQDAGAVWIFTRSGNSWTQVGEKLVGSDSLGKTRQGFSVAISFDGMTAGIGGPLDNQSLGAVWIFSNNEYSWKQQGSKLVGNGSVGSSQQGSSVALSKDGNTAIFGGVFDNSWQGAAWIFIRK